MIRYARSLITAMKRRGHSRSLMLVGAGSIIDRPLHLTSPRGVSIGSSCYIGPQGYIAGDGGLLIEDGVMIGPMVYLQTSAHNFDSVDLEALPYDHRIQRKPIHIERLAWLGGRVTVIPGVRIGRGAVIGSGSVVSRDIPERAIAVGNPARVVGYRNREQFERLSAGDSYLDFKRHTGAVDTWIDTALERASRDQS